MPTHGPDRDGVIQPVKVIDKQSFEYVIRSGAAGGVAGSAAKTLIAPLDRVKILFQTSNPDYKKFSGSFSGLFKAVKNIYTLDGLWGLYQGHSATLLRIFPYAAIKFVMYEQLRTVLIPTDDHETAARRLLTGSLAGVTSVFYTYPLDLIRVRLAFQTKNMETSHKGRFMKTFNAIYHETPRLPLTAKSQSPLVVVQNLSNFYRGFAPTIMGMIPYAGVSFYTHDVFHDFLRSDQLAHITVRNEERKSTTKLAHTKETSHDKRKPLHTWAQLFAGGSAGMLAQAAAYPFEVIRRRMQVGGVVNKSGEYFDIAKTAGMIYREGGLKGFYIGLSIGFIKVVPMFACSFYVYERVKTRLGI